MKFISEMPTSSKVISGFVMLFWIIYPNGVSNIAHWVSQNIGGGNMVSGIILIALSAISLAYMITFIILVIYYPILGVILLYKKVVKSIMK